MAFKHNRSLRIVKRTGQRYEYINKSVGILSKLLVGIDKQITDRGHSYEEFKKRIYPHRTSGGNFHYCLAVAILMPALGAINDQAKSLICRTNLRQLATGIELYSMNHNNKALYSTGGENYWPMQIAPYLDDSEYEQNPEDALEGSMKVMWCSSTKAPTEPTGWSPGTAENRWRCQIPNFGDEGSYGINSWVGGWELGSKPETGGGYGLLKEDQAKSYRKLMPDKGNIPVFADSIWMGSIPRHTDPSLSEEYLPYGEFWDPAYGPGMGRFVIDRHNMKINVAFIDGRAVSVKLNELWYLPWNRAFKKTEVQVPL